MSPSPDFEGALKSYYLFDIAQEVNLKGCERILNELALRQQFRLKRPAKSVLIDEAPLSFPVPTPQLKEISVLKSFPHAASAEIRGKIWNFGALSLCLHIETQEPMALQSLLDLSYAIENDHELDSLFEDVAKRIMADLSPALKSPVFSKFIEDYLIIQYKPQTYQGVEKVLDAFLEDDLFYKILLTEPHLTLSVQTRELLRSQSLKYSNRDLVLIDWNSSFVCSEGDSEDICDTIEFALCQLLELEYYDDLLDKKLSSLYRATADAPRTLFRSPFAKHARDAALIYIEISEIVEKVENALKVIGDFYYARVFRTSVERFRLKDWQQSVDKKLKNLAEVANLLQNEVHTKRTLILEILIVIFFAIEIAPFLIKWF